MMAALPLMVAWCRSEAIAPQAMVLLHFAAMFLPALLLRRSIAHWPPRVLSLVCTLLLASGAVAVLWASAPVQLAGRGAGARRRLVAGLGRPALVAGAAQPPGHVAAARGASAMRR